MKLRKIGEKVKNFFKRKFKRSSLKTEKTQKMVKNLNFLFRKPQIFAYNLIGRKASWIIPLFKGLDTSLEKSELKISFRAYVSLTVLTSIIVSAFIFVLTPVIFYFWLGTELLSSFLFGIGFAMLGGAFTVITFYLYPIYRADTFKRKLEDELPFATAYMAVLAGAGVPSDKIFRSMAKINAPLAVTVEAKTIVRDIELLGLDAVSALERASKRSPSEAFKNLLQGFIATIHSGGNLAAYLLERSKEFMRMKRTALQKFADTLSILAEFYVAILVAGPLLLVIMLAVMAMLGGAGEMGFLDPKLLLYLLTYIGVPVASLIFLIILDMISPRW